MPHRHPCRICIGVLVLVIAGLVWVFMHDLVLEAASASPPAGQTQDIPVGSAVTTIHGVAYGPFRPGQSPDLQIFPTLAEVQADIPLLKAVANGVRTFSCVHLETVITATAEDGLPLLQGVWLGSDATANQAELACAVTAAATHPQIKSLGVGNETILAGTLTVPQLCRYLADAKTQSSLPVTTAEPWPVWLAHPELVECVDYVSVNLYAYWDGVAIEDAVAYTAQRYAEVSDVAGAKAVVLSEVGWPSAGAAVGAAVPGITEQAQFAADFSSWAKSDSVSWYWFEAMDEPWKCEQGGAAVECHWGLYASDRTPKPAQGALVSSAIWLPVVANQPASTPTATATPIATPGPPLPVCAITRPTSNSTVTTSGNCAISITGTVQGAPSGSYFDFSVHTDQWYTQNAQAQAPQPSGSWQASPIYLGGQSGYNNHTILARLHSSTGAVVATCQVDGIVRSNNCSIGRTAAVTPE